MRQHIAVEQHPAEHGQREADDEGPGPAHRGDPVRQAFAEGRFGIRGIGHVAADRAALANGFQDVGFFRLELVQGFAEQMLGELLQRVRGIHRAQLA